MTADWEPLIDAARRCREHAYAPYSGFRVGAALRDLSGHVYTGCNVENASYGATVCAERIALFKMVSEGARRFDAVAVYTEADPAAMPCGLCRQVLGEFQAGARVIVASPASVEVIDFASLLPRPFLFEARSET